MTLPHHPTYGSVTGKWIDLGSNWWESPSVERFWGDKWTDEFCRQKGVEHALDHMCDSLNFVVVGIYWWLCGWWTHSYPAGHCHHRVSGPTYSGTKNIIAIWTLAGEGEVFGERLVINRFTIKFTW